MLYVVWMLIVMMSWPKQDANETYRSRFDRTFNVALALGEAVDRASIDGNWPRERSKELAAILLSTVKSESMFLARDVQSGRRLSSVGAGCFMQVHPVHDGTAGIAWGSLLGTGLKQSRNCAFIGTMLMLRSLKACEGRSIAAAFSNYIRGHGCSSGEDGQRRAAYVRELLF